MFGKFFGSKNKAAAVDDELSQLESTPSNDKKVVVDPKNSASLIGTIPKSLHFLDLDQFTSVKLATGEYSDKASTLLPLSIQSDKEIVLLAIQHGLSPFFLHKEMKDDPDVSKILVEKYLNASDIELIYDKFHRSLFE